jgi:polysaccharide biosynthesis transport protein
MGNDAFQTSLRDLAAIIFRRKWDFLLVFATATCIGATWLWLVRGDAWEVSGKVLVRAGREQTPPPTMLAERGMMLSDPQQYVNTEVEFLRNRDLIARVVDRMGLDRPSAPNASPSGVVPRIRHALRSGVDRPREWVNHALVRSGARPAIAPRDAIVAQLYDGLAVIPRRNAGVIEVRLYRPHREGGAALLNALLHEYQHFRREHFEDGSVAGFFDARVTEVAQSLAEIEAHLSALGVEGGAAIVEQEKILLTRVADVEQSASAALRALRHAEARRDRVEHQIEKEHPEFTSVSTFRDDAFAQALLRDLIDLDRTASELRLQELEHGVRTQVNREQRRELLQHLRAGLRTDVEERRALYLAHTAEIRVLRDRLATLQQQQVDWRALERSRRSLEENYLFYRNRQEEASANRALARHQLDNVSILETAVDPVRPAGPRKLSLLMVIIFVAGLAAAAWIAVAEFFDHRIHSVDTLEHRLGIPVLGTVPLYEARRASARPTRRARSSREAANV